MAVDGFSFYRPLKKAHLPPACPRQACRIVALNRAGIISATIGVAPTYCLSQVISVKGQQIAEGSNYENRQTGGSKQLAAREFRAEG